MQVTCMRLLHVSHTVYVCSVYACVPVCPCHLAWDVMGNHESVTGSPLITCDHRWYHGCLDIQIWIRVQQQRHLDDAITSPIKVHRLLSTACSLLSPLSSFLLLPTPPSSSCSLRLLLVLMVPPLPPPPPRLRNPPHDHDDPTRLQHPPLLDRHPPASPPRPSHPPAPAPQQRAP